MSTDSAATEVLGTEPHEGEGLKVHIIRAMSSTTSSISAPMEEEKRTEELRVLLCLSGSVAAMKAVELVEAFRASACVKLALSNAAMHFIDLQTLNASGVSVFSDRHEWQAYKERGDPVLHIEVIQLSNSVREPIFLSYSCIFILEVSDIVSCFTELNLDF